MKNTLIVLILALLTACGGGGGGGSSKTSNAPPDSPPPDSNPPGSNPSYSPFVGGFPAVLLPDNNAALLRCDVSSPVPAGSTITGTVRFERVPLHPVIGLDYANTAQNPVRGAVVEAVLSSAGQCTDNVVATSLTDGQGDYGLVVEPASQSVCVRVRAQLYRAAGNGDSWDIQVTDNTQQNAPFYLIDGPATPASQPQRNLLAESGWTGSSYGEPRAAAPFAILDSACDAMSAVLDVAPTAQLPTLYFRWSENNTAADGQYEDGEIGSSLYRSVSNGSVVVDEIFVLGDDDLDTDEYDPHVVIHEYGHFVSNNFFRSDSLGGDHGLDSFLDMTVAFDEGWADAFSGIALNGVISNPQVYHDTLGPRQSSGFQFDMDNEARLFVAPWTTGWYSESSVFEIIYDLYDATSDNADALNLGFSPIFDAMVAHAQTPALASIFSFVNALKQQNPASSAAIDALLAGENIESVVDDYGSAEQANAELNGADDVAPYLPSLLLNQSQLVCSNDQYGVYNKLSVFQYLAFTPGATRNFTVTLTPRTDFGAGGRGGVEVYDRGLFVGGDYADSEGETLIRNVGLTANRTYLFSVYDYNNVVEDEVSSVTGRRCFDLVID